MFSVKSAVISIFLIIGSFQLHGNSSDAPTLRYLSTHSLDHIKFYMGKFGVTEEHVYALNDAISNERKGFFGYHGASREFRIYQDVIRFAIEEILGIAIREDFHFLRVPGDPSLNFESADEYLMLSHAKKLPDGASDKQVCLPINIALYENFYFEELCSIAGFVKESHHSLFEKLLIPFFDQLGIDPKNIQKAFQIARAKIPNKGILLQFFDTPNYELLDKFAYCSLSTGKRYFSNTAVSEILLNPMQTAFPLLRLVINNRQITNPYSSLVIKRYDLTSDYSLQAYEDALRHYLKSLPADRSTSEKYKAELLSLWSIL